MNRWPTIATIEDQFKVRDLDDSLRKFKRKINFPWDLVKGTLRVFEGVLVYPVANNHDELAYLDENKDVQYGDKPRFRYTSLPEFFEDPDNRNDLAEIYENGTKMLGVRYTPKNSSSLLVNNAETASQFTASLDASAITLDNVVYKQGSGSIRFTNTVSAGTAAVSNTSTSVNDTNYKRKYYFRSIFLDAVPTSISMQYGNDNANYLSTTVTTQFSGQPFVADDWNLIAMDLNTATVTGTINPTAFDYEYILLTGAASGTYYIDASYLRSWDLLDYWYYNTYRVKTVGQTSPSQEYCYNSSDVYSPDSEIVGDSEWIDVIMYEAMLSSISEKENKVLFDTFTAKQDDAMSDLYENYPSLKPLIITGTWNFETDFFPRCR